MHDTENRNSQQKNNKTFCINHISITFARSTKETHGRFRKEFIKTLSIPGEIINAATTEGSVLAARFGIMAVPTVLFFNEENEIIEKAYSVPQVRRVVDSLVEAKI